MEKDYCILQYFQEKNYKDNFRKKHKKKKKKPCRKTLQQSIVFCKEIYSCNSQPAQHKKNKIDKGNFEKSNNKKNHVRNDCSNPQYFKEKKSTKLNFQSA